MRNTKIILEETSLLINAPSFELGLKWEFVFNGDKIFAEVLDLNFNQSIEEGRGFRKGDCLEGLLNIVQEWDYSTNRYINKSYGVIKVVRHVSAPLEEISRNIWTH